MANFSVPFLALCACLLFGGPLYVSAWGQEGHQVIAQLADNMLSDVARPQVYALMDPGQTLVEISTWPDDYSHSSQGSWSGCLHYANIPQPEPLYNKSDCTTVDGVPNCCVIASIYNYTAILENGTSTAEAMEVASLTGEPTPLSFLVHFVGDIHQPLHAGFDCDEGGTKVDVVLKGYSQSLHSAWDSGIIDNYNKNYASFAKELQGTIDSNPKISKMYTLYMKPEIWADESYNNYVRHVVYDFSTGLHNNHTGNPVIYPAGQGCPIKGVQTLPNDYQTRNIEAVKQRLMAGGIRLATLLNSIFQ